MIGYVKIYKPELKVKELKVYQAYYCGICAALGDRYGLIYRNLLNYDAVFIAAALDSIIGHQCGYEEFRCILHPIQKKARCIGSESVEYAADLTVYLSYKKLIDNLEDENSLASRIGAGILKRQYLKAGERLGNAAGEIDKCLSDLHALEADASDSIDATADCYGRIIGAAFSNAPGNGFDIDAAEWMGYNIGKWIYLMDALSDIERDIRKKQYNPILMRFPKEPDEGIEDYKEKISGRISYVAYTTLDESTKAYDLIDKNVNSGIIRNILYEGMYSVTERILNGDTIDGAEESI